MGTLFDKIDWTGLGSLKPVIVGLINSNTGEGKDDIFLETTVDSILYEVREEGEVGWSRFRNFLDQEAVGWFFS